MSASSGESIAQVAAQLDGASKALSAMRVLSADEAERMDRLASQLLEVSSPPRIDGVHERLGTAPASADEFDKLAGWMDAADGEG